MTGTWSPLAHTAPSSIGLMLLLSDGTVIAENSGTSNAWYKLTPDSTGSYANGTWSTISAMRDTRLYFASQVLPDGRVFVAGGEYGTGGSTGETYDPVTDVWTPAPAQASRISDANSELLPDGRVLIALVTGNLRMTIIFDPATNTWTAGPTANGIHNESAWVKLPDNSSLMVDRLSTNSERYIPSLNQWVVDATVPVALYDPFGDETGPGFLLPDGRAFFVGSPSNTAFYTPSGSTSPGTWAAGPTIPSGLGAPDAAGAMMPNGKILLALSPTPTSSNHFPSPTSFYEFDYTTNTFTQVNAPAGGSTVNHPSYYTNMLALPDGTILYSEFGSRAYVYTPDGTPLVAGKPTITNIAHNSPNLYTLTGTLLNGISQGAAYGDDGQMSTNYPIVRLRDDSGHVYYARTFNWSNTGVMTGNTPVTTQFSLPGGLPEGAYHLSVIANGIASAEQTFLTGSIVVLSTTPAVGTAVTSPPVDFSVTFSSAYDPAQVQLSGFTVNGIVASSYTATNSTTITYHFGSSPVTAQGNQTIALAAGSVVQLSDGQPLSLFSGTFIYDSTNDPPTIAAPGTQTIFKNGTVAFSTAAANGITLADVDNYSAADESLTLTVTHGSVSLTTTGLTSFSGVGTSTLSATGTIAALNAALQTLVFTPAVNFVGTAVLTIKLNDQGSGLLLPPRQATATVIIQVRPSPNAPSSTVDINTGPASASPGNLLTIGTVTYFTATDPGHGTELWRTDGTSAGTLLLKDVNPNTPSSSIASLTNLNGTLIFVANDGVNGTELWKSDGTTSGTVLLKDINAGSASASPANLLVIGTTLYFSANDATAGTELWKSDGTSVGTTRVKDIVSGTTSSSPSQFANVNGTLFFAATDGSTAHGVELWKSNGTSAGTVMVADINTTAAGASSSPTNLKNVNGVLFFTANDGLNGIELWKSDGTSGGTVMVKDIVSGSGGLTSVSGFTAVGSTLVFVANDGANGTELWTSDGSSGGTNIIDISAGSASSSPTSLTLIGSTVYFAATTTATGVELWKWDAVNGVSLVRDITGSAASSSPAGLANISGTLYFRATTTSTGLELYTSDGSSGGTVLVKDINSGSTSSTPGNFVLLNGKAVFTATDALTGTELWNTDGTTVNTALLSDLNTSTASAAIANAVSFGGYLYFAATDTTHGAELWRSDGTAGGTMLFKDILVGTSSSSPANLLVIGNTLYFSANNSTNGIELWKSDGTAAGTVLVKDIASGATSSSPANFVNLNGTLYFSATDGSTAHGIELWRSDGSAPGTTMVMDIAAGTTSSSPANLTNVNGTLYFTANDGTNGIELWMSDGSGTSLVKDINAGGNSSPAGLVAFNNRLYFRATDGTNGVELWTSDGSDSGTVLLKDINSGASSSTPSSFIVCNNKLYFTANDGSTGIELWSTDGTSGGTALVDDINVGSGGASPANLTSVGGTLYFSATDGSSGVELWKSDGTAAGTVLLSDINAGAGSSSPTSFLVAGDVLYFTATDSSADTELWQTAGVAGGTIRAADVYSGGSSSTPANLAVVGNTLYFSATDAAHGAELWTLDITNNGPTTSGLSPIVTDPASTSNVNLAAAFADDHDQATGLLYSISGNTNPSLFSSIVIDGNTGVLTLQYAGAGSASLTVTADDSSGVSVQTVLTVTVNSAQALTPVVTATTTLEDVQSTSGLVISPNAANGAEVTHFKIGGIANGSLYRADGITQIHNGDFITVAQGAAGLKFTPAQDFNGLTSFQVWASTTADDAGITNSAATANITVTAVNDPPQHAVPGTQAVNSGTVRTFNTANGNKISIADVDAGSGNLQTTLTAVGGKLTLSTIAGLSFTTGDGTADATMTFTGTLATINAALDGLTFTPNAGFSGAGSLRIQTSDQGNTGGPAQSDDDTITVSVNAAPTVTGVYARGTGTGGANWAASFLNYMTNNNLGSTLGYKLSVGANQLRSLPWLNVNTVSVVFSEQTAIAKNDLTLVGSSNGPTLPLVNDATFTTTLVDATTFVATWGFTAALPRDKILLHLGNTVVDLAGAVLDGEWTTSTSTVSGDGTGGGDFNFRFNMLPGDANFNNTVTFGEIALAQSHVGQNTGTPNYNYREDFNGSGSMTFGEIAQAQALVGGGLAVLNEPIVPSSGPSQAVAVVVAFPTLDGTNEAYVASSFVPLTQEQPALLVTERPVVPPVSSAATNLAATTARASTKPADLAQAAESEAPITVVHPAQVVPKTARRAPTTARRN